MRKRYILTGGTDGLGKAFAEICLKNGIEIICIDRKKPDYDCIYIEADLSDEKTIERTADLIKDQYPTFDALINCAGVISFEPANNISYSELQRLYAVNLFAPVYLTSLLFETIKKNGADLLNVGSTAGTKPYLEHINYGTSKWAMRGFSLNLQLELKGTPCRVIQLNPGGIQTKIYEKFRGVEQDVKSFMLPQDIADIMYYTLSLPKSVEVSEILVNRK
ncbi:MAG TPA: SDR family oxidoreductase [Alphaproteobacteria bacterium]